MFLFFLLNIEVDYKGCAINLINNIIDQKKQRDSQMDDRKSSTMNSIFLGSTLEKPNVELIINAVATILHSQMLEVGACFKVSITFFPKAKSRIGLKTTGFKIVRFSFEYRISAKARPSPKRVTSFSSLRRSTSSRSLKPSTSRESHSSERPPPSKTSSSS